MDVLVADNVSRRYDDTVALDGVSLSVAVGEVFALVGPNGAGKTTLVRALTGTTDAEGAVELFDVSPQAVDRERIGLLPQNFDPPARLTARELVEYYGGLYDSARPTEELLAEVGMTESADTYYENLSGGQQRRTCVATTLVNDPDLLVLDEPTTGIDPAGRRTLWELIERLAAGGTTVFLTTHYMDEAERLADRVGLLASGELVACDTPAKLIEAYGGDSLLTVEGTFPANLPADLDYDATLSDDRLTIRNIEPPEIGTIAEVLAERGIAYDSLTWREPDLEDVYLELSGEPVGPDGPTSGIDSLADPSDDERTTEHAQQPAPGGDSR